MFLHGSFQFSNVGVRFVFATFGIDRVVHRIGIVVVVVLFLFTIQGADLFLEQGDRSVVVVLVFGIADRR